MKSAEMESEVRRGKVEVRWERVEVRREEG